MTYQRDLTKQIDMELANLITTHCAKVGSGIIAALEAATLSLKKDLSAYVYASDEEMTHAFDAGAYYLTYAAVTSLSGALAQIFKDEHLKDWIIDGVQTGLLQAKINVSAHESSNQSH